MKLMIAMCLLTSMAIGQEAPAPALGVVPSLVINIVGQQANSYDVKVTNRSGHAVTAFALRLAPGYGRQDCDGPCSRVEMVADNARPAIKAGESVDLGIGSSIMNAGTVVTEAAIFDDESYQGDERAAAVLVAQQIGRQAEYDRLIAAVTAIITTRAGDASKTAQIRIKLNELSVQLDPAMSQTFKRWFPGLAGCTRRYARWMKAAATKEKRLVAESMERFADGGAPGNPSLAQWWSAMQQQLAPFGCNGCAARAMSPKAPASSRNVAQPCREDIMPILLTASLVDDGSLVEVEEEPEMEAELSEEDGATLDADALVPGTRMPARPPARAAAAEPSAKTDVPANAPVPSPKPVAPTLPSGVPLVPAPDGKGYLLGRLGFSNRPVPDYVMYRAFFRDIATFGDMALYEEVRWDLSRQRVENRGPRAGGLNKAEIATLQQVAADTNRQVGVVFTKKETLLRAKVPIYGGWLLFAPPIPGLRELDIQEAQTLNTGIRRLRTKLGAASFTRLDRFARSVYHAQPGKMVLTHLTDDAIHTRFFRYLAVLDGIADSVTARQEEAKRQNELRVAGLAEKDWALLLKVAKDYQQLFDRLYNPFPQSIQPTDAAADEETTRVLAPGPARAAVPALGMRAYPAGAAPSAQTTRGASAAMPSLGETMHSNPVMLNEPQAGLQGMPVPLGTLTLTPEARRKELERKHDELELELMTDMAQLKAGLGEPRFQKFEAYLHQLYANAGFETAVPAEEKVKKVVAQQRKKQGAEIIRHGNEGRQ